MTNPPTTTALFQISPIIILIGTIGLILFVAVFLKKDTAKSVLLAFGTAGLAAAILSALKLLPLSKMVLKNLGPQNLYTPLMVFDSIIFDQLFLFTIVFLCIFLFGVLVLSTSLWQTYPWEWPIFMVLLQGSLIGMILLASTRNLIFFAIAFELASAPSYVLVGFRKFNPRSAEGSAKYAIFGAACSAIMLYGISLLYGMTGSFDLQDISLVLAAREITGLQVIALLSLLVGIGFKIALVPMHFWNPDAFEAAGADVAAWLSVASKSATLIALARFVQILTLPGSGSFNQSMMITFSILAIITMTVANLSAYWQKSVKRLLAYSSIAHAGYIVTAMTVISGSAALVAVISYVVVYMLMNLGAFTVVGLIEQQTGSDDLESFSGLSSRSPGLSAFMMFFLFSLVGLPPLAGFAVKWILLSVLWEQHMTVLVVAILANTLFSLFYYMRITRAMYFETSSLSKLKMPTSITWLLTICAGGLFFLFLGWGELIAFFTDLFTGLYPLMA